MLDICLRVWNILELIFANVWFIPQFRRTIRVKWVSTNTQASNKKGAQLAKKQATATPEAVLFFKRLFLFKCFFMQILKLQNNARWIHMKLVDVMLWKITECTQAMNPEGFE